MSKIKNYLPAIVYGLIAVVTLGVGYVAADGGSPVYTIENAYFGAFDIDTGEEMFGAITMDKTTFDNGIHIAGEGLDIYGGDLDVDVASDFSSTVNMSATSTIPWMDASFQLELDFTRATTTYGGATETELVIGTIQHTGADLLCTDAWVDISSATGLFAYDIRVGTSTSATSSDAHLIDATTGGHEIGSTTTDILNKEDDEGTTSDEVWDLNNSEYLAVTMVYNAVNATSSATFTSAGANAGAGRLHVDCRTRY
jgi:hypothetical protein